jgi:hypothetical protein
MDIPVLCSLLTRAGMILCSAAVRGGNWRVAGDFDEIKSCVASFTAE